MSILGWAISEAQPEEVANESGVLIVNDDFLEPQFRRACEDVIPTPAGVDSRDVQNAFIYLKENITMPHSA
jgi:hypothetical protein